MRLPTPTTFKLNNNNFEIIPLVPRLKLTICLPRCCARPGSEFWVKRTNPRGLRAFAVLWQIPWRFRRFETYWNASFVQELQTISFLEALTKRNYRNPRWQLKVLDILSWHSQSPFFMFEVIQVWKFFHPRRTFEYLEERFERFEINPFK